MEYYKCDSGILRCGDCKDEMKTLPNNHVTGIVTDPPYGLRFMDKKWDYDIPSVEIFKEMYRVLKPGGFMLCFAGSRTQHRMAVNIEDAGFELRDVIMWVYGSGFPKSYNIGKGIDKKLGNEREKYLKTDGIGSDSGSGRYNFNNGNSKLESEYYDSKGNTIWEGYGTALKPAYEPIIIAMKPNDGGFVDNALKHGVAGINIDECRVDTKDKLSFGSRELGDGNKYGKCNPTTEGIQNTHGRFPANIIHDGSDEVLGLFPNNKSSDAIRRNKNDAKEYTCYGNYKDTESSGFNDSGSAARFFYSAKASKSERNAGCEDLEAKQKYKKDGSGNSHEIFTSEAATDKNWKAKNPNLPQQNNHPTVKPLSLMTYLTKLVKMPENTLILDPFAGSGSTLLACIRNNINFIGIEMSEEYCEIAKARIENEREQITMDF